jgi:pyoverdine/dityrosine biosynthesis protein Dit1
MAKDVKKIYEFGAMVNIASDGVLFNGECDEIHSNSGANV